MLDRAWELGCVYRDTADIDCDNEELSGVMKMMSVRCSTTTATDDMAEFSRSRSTGFLSFFSLVLFPSWLSSFSFGYVRPILSSIS